MESFTKTNGFEVVLHSYSTNAILECLFCLGNTRTVEEEIDILRKGVKSSNEILAKQRNSSKFEKLLFSRIFHATCRIPRFVRMSKFEGSELYNIAANAGRHAPGRHKQSAYARATGILDRYRDVYPKTS